MPKCFNCPFCFNCKSISAVKIRISQHPDISFSIISSWPLRTQQRFEQNMNGDQETVETFNIRLISGFMFGSFSAVTHDKEANGLATGRNRSPFSGVVGGPHSRIRAPKSSRGKSFAPARKWMDHDGLVE